MVGFGNSYSHASSNRTPQSEHLCCRPFTAFHSWFLFEHDKRCWTLFLIAVQWSSRILLHVLGIQLRADETTRPKWTSSDSSDSILQYSLLCGAGWSTPARHLCRRYGIVDSRHFSTSHFFATLFISSFRRPPSQPILNLWSSTPLLSLLCDP